jgi:hypothetical protein
MRREWELEDLIECWTLDEAEFKLLANKTGSTRLGFALMLKFFEQEARFPRWEDVPKAAVEFVSGQVKVDAALFAEYSWSGRTIKYHRAQLTATTMARGGMESIRSLEELIVVDEPGGRRGFLQELKQDPGPIQLDTLLAEIVKLERVKAIGLPPGLFEGVSEKVMAGWRTRAMKRHPFDFAAAQAPVRLTLLAALCWAQGPVYPVVGKRTLEDIVAKAKANEKAFNIRVRVKLRGSYSHHYRRGLPTLLNAVSFRCNNEAFRPVMDALALLKRYQDSDVDFYDPAETVPLAHVVPEDCKEAVVDPDTGLIERIP